MIAPSTDKRRIAAVIVAEPRVSRRGLPVDVQTTLPKTIERLRRCQRVDVTIVVHRRDATLPPVEGVRFHATDLELNDALHAKSIAARKWTPTAWRGGLGGATIYDELLAPAAMVEALEAAHADAALVVGPDWPEVDPAMCDAVIERHLENPERYRLTFTQAAPGRCGCAIAKSLLGEMARHGTAIGTMLDYNPRAPQADPIARDVCVQIDAAARAPGQRFTTDVPVGATLPQQVTLELTTDRPSYGPITPQHNLALDRPPIDVDTARRVFEQLAARPDAVVTLGGLGDALMHRQWDRIVEAAHDAGLWGIGIETDLRVDEDTLRRIVDLPLDMVVVRLNADEPATYARLMGDDAHTQVLDHIQWLLQHRTDSLPWVVPHMIKTIDNVAEMESFVDRWTICCGQAVVTGPPQAAEATAVMDMAPPRRAACRQLARRMTIHSNGQVARCDQDWLGEHAVGNVADETIDTLWRRVRKVYDEHEAGAYSGACANCRQWHRP